MSELLRLILANALGAGILALAAWGVSFRVRRQSLVHGLCVLALVKLVAPPIVPLPLLPEWTLPEWTLPALTQPAGPVTAVIEAEAPVGTTAPPTGIPAVSAPSVAVLLATEGAALPAFGGEDPSPGKNDGPPARPRALVESSTARGLADLAPLARGGLFGGALLVAALAFLRIRRFRRLLRLAVPAPPPLTARAAELAERVGLRHAPPVLLLPARVPPMLWPGRRGPLLLMPKDLLPELGDEECDTLLVHELAHVRRRDHWVRFLELAVTVAFWWYPVAWWVRRALRRAEERCCDEWVLRVMPGSASAYAEGLLKSLDFVATEPDPLPVGASGAGPVRDLEVRLKEILMTKPKPHLNGPVRLALAAAAALALAAFPTQAQSPGPEEAAPPVSPAEELPPAPPEIADVAPPADPAPPALAPTPPEAAPAPPAAPAFASPLPEAAPAAPADAAPPTLAAPAPPAPILATPLPEPRPEVRPRPAPAPRPAPMPRPAAEPRRGRAPAPVVLPADSEEPPENEATRREFEEQHRKMARQRSELHARELALAQERMAREAPAEQEMLQAEAQRLRASGEIQDAERVEEHARLAAERMGVQRRELELEQTRLARQQEEEDALQRTLEQLQNLEGEGRDEEASALRTQLAALQGERVRRSLAHEERQLALQRKALELEHRARAAELEYERELAARDHSDLGAHLERQRERLEWEQGLARREIELLEAEQAVRARELEVHEHESAGRHDAAEAVRAETENMRRDVEALRRGLQEEHLLRAGSDLAVQMESQLEALRQLEAEGGGGSAGVAREIARLEAALEALRQ